MSDLKEDLNRALRTIPVGMAPVEQAKHQGRRIRTRRRVTVLAGALAVVAVAAGYPALTKTVAPAAVAPAGKATPTASSTGRATHDPVLTQSPGATATRGPNGLVAVGGLIAAGTLGGNRWQAVVSPQNANLSVTFARKGGEVLGTDGADFNNPTVGNGTDAANPVVFIGSTSDGTNYAIYGETSDRVAYLIVTFSDGQRLKLTPVSVNGIRYFTWAAPVATPVASVTVYLGGPYATNGQTETAVPLDLPGQPPLFNLIQKTGAAVPPRAVKVVASGTMAGEGNWTVTAYEGPWGTCLVANPGGPYCAPGQQLASNTVLGGWTYNVTNSTGPNNGLDFGSVAPAATTVRVNYGPVGYAGPTVHTETVQAVHVGNEDLFVFPLMDGNDGAYSWTAYNASGEPVASSDSIPVSPFSS